MQNINTATRGFGGGILRFFFYFPQRLEVKLYLRFQTFPMKSTLIKGFSWMQRREGSLTSEKGLRPCHWKQAKSYKVIKGGNKVLGNVGKHGGNFTDT